MTDKQRDVLLALNLIQMQAADAPEEDGYSTGEIAGRCRLPIRATAALLSQMRVLQWVRSFPGLDRVGWELTGRGVEALERDAGRIPR